ncbi:MAG: hypothetical protein CMH30_09045 [Micavibrio sp.]|nr:hypothetical protein [Micavibrio sp.]|tara:strand:- start:1862 stop:2992 length:1131 start_codon:yes stop_codon:yes gene_type:complete
MDSKTLYNIKVFEKLAAPLMNAVLRGSYQKKGAVEADDVAQISSLLRTSIKMSKALSDSFQPSNNDDADALRLAVACLVSPIIAEHFAKTGKDLSDEDIGQFSDVFDGILDFTDKFAEAKDAANRRLRLANPDPISVSDRLVFDEDQMTIQAMQALLPVVIRVAEYSFGHDHKELLAEITTKLQSRAKIVARALFGRADDISDQKLSELGVLRSLTHIYASCHMAEKRRYEEMDEKLREKSMNKTGELSLDTLWHMFEMRSGLMVALTKNLMVTPEDESASSSEKAAPKEALKATKASSNKVQESEAPALGNPMSFFSKGGATKPKTIIGEDKDDDEDDDGSEGRRGGGEKSKVNPDLKPPKANPMGYFGAKKGGM